MPLGGAVLGAVSLGYGIYKDIDNNNKANDIKNSIKTPVDQIPQEFYQNREIARQMAQIGMPQQQYNNSLDNINSTQAAGISAAQNSNNPGGAITSIVRNSNNAKGQLDAEDAQSRQNNQRYFIQENSKLGERKDQQEQANVFDPYTRDFNQMQAYRGAATTGEQNLVNAGLSGALAYMNYKTPRTPSVVAPSVAPTNTNLQIPQNLWGMPGLDQNQYDPSMQEYYQRKYAGGNY